MATQSQIDRLTSQLEAMTTQSNETGAGLDEAWHLICGTLVFFMQAGFALLEAGSVRSKNAVNILFKNMIDGAVSAICFWTIGYGFAYGDTANGFIGKDNFGLTEDDFDVGNASTNDLQYHTFFFQWAFAATAATIVSGSVAERCKVEAYFIYSAFITIWTYPVIVHWGWGNGWLSPFSSQVDEYMFYGKESNNFVDFAGSGIVHTVGGLTGLVAAIALGARKGRFTASGEVVDFPGHNTVLVVLGTIILWVGWYGFNAGSTLCIVGDCSKLAAKVAVVTTIAAASAALTMVGLQTFLFGHYDVAQVCNAILAGLVSITAPCAVVDLWAAWIIGLCGTFVYVLASKLLLKLKIDDPLDAAPIHGFCGIWGVLSVGIFGNDDNAAFAGYVGSAAGNHPFRTGEQFGVQLLGILCISCWTVAFAIILFYGMKYTIGIRVSEEVEELGLDTSEHGTKAYSYITWTEADAKNSVSNKHGVKKSMEERETVEEGEAGTVAVAIEAK